MSLNIESRPSDSPYIERVWRSRSHDLDQFISIAINEWDFVTWTQEGKTYHSLQGPETKAVPAPVPQHAEFFGILFKSGTFMPHLPVCQFLGNSVDLPGASCNRFWLHSDVWETPTFDNAEAFVTRLVREGVLVHDPVIYEVLQGATPDLSPRTVQRRFLQATGINQRTMQQVTRARQAAVMLQEGNPIIDTTYALGFADQPHLTHSLKHFIGQTPFQLAANPAEMSLLYKTSAAR
jgi:AraC-like DNA-binding protein